MPKTYDMPRMSDTMEEGTLIKWNVKVGDHVKAGDEVADIETDKATMPMPVYDDGVVAKLVAQPGQALKVGQMILVLAVGKESIEEAAKAAEAGAASGSASGGASAGGSAGAGRPDAPAKKEGPAATPTAPPAPAPAGRQRVSPLARKIAEEKGLNLAQIKGTGPEGRIIKRDVEAAQTSTSPSATPGADESPSSKSEIRNPKSEIPPTLETRLIPVSNMRKTIARRLVESKTTIPHFTVTTSVSMDSLMALRKTLNEQLAPQGIKLSVNDFIVRAAALALALHPGVNSSWTDNGIQQHGTINIGIAVSLPADRGGGLVVPTVRDALNKGLRAISTETWILAKKARTKGLTIEEMSDGTFTISNLGMFGVDHFEAIINPPQAAILAVGAAVEKPVVREGKIVIGNEMACTLSADHRAVDGAMAAEYLQTLKKLLENPAALLV